MRQVGAEARFGERVYRPRSEGGVGGPRRVSWKVAEVRFGAVRWANGVSYLRTASPISARNGPRFARRTYKHRNRTNPACAAILGRVACEPSQILPKWPDKALG